MTITIELNEHEARALAQMCKRFGHHHAQSLSSKFDFYDGAPEADVMMDAVIKVQRALREAGHSPR